MLAGYALSCRKQVYEGLESDSTPTGVIFLGPVTPDELRILYQHALAVVFPSLYEGFGLPPLEAMAAGTPVVAMPFCRCPKLAVMQRSTPLGSRRMTCRGRWSASRAQPSYRAAMRVRGSSRALQFRWEKTAQLTYELYRSAVLCPSERSLHNRRMLREAIMRWSQPDRHSLFLDRDLSVPDEQILGVRNAWKALREALERRVKREVRPVSSCQGPQKGVKSNNGPRKRRKKGIARRSPFL